MALLVVASAAFASTSMDARRVHYADAAYQSVLTSNDHSGAAKADTVYLYGGPGTAEGKFQNAVNPTLPDMQGWVGVDITTSPFSKWQVSTFNSPDGSAAAWCGEYLPPCPGGDTSEGYGNNYKENLVWYGTVADNGLSTNVTVTFDANVDSEPGFDFLEVQYYQTGAAAWSTEGAYDAVQSLTGETLNFTVDAADLYGVGSNQVRIRFRGYSDGAWSDIDCNWPTAAGLCQIDNISISGDNGLPSTTDNFSAGIGGSNFVSEIDTGVGNFAKVWPSLTTIDPCNDNNTPMVAFIDDGVVVPCTGGTLGTTYTYGPSGYTHNLTGGCLGPANHAQNEVWSPAIEWDDDLGNWIGDTHAGGIYGWDQYMHLPLANGMFMVWHVRTSADNGVTWTGWMDRGFVTYSNTPFLGRREEEVTDLLVQLPTHVQLGFGIDELGWFWGFEGTDGTPAPYFDNASFRTFEITGPSIVTRELEIAQDNFPSIGTIDYVNLGANDISFDRAEDINGSDFPGIVPGDSITFDVVPVRPGAVLNGPPSLYYTMKTNPLFDPFRLHPTTGSVVGDSVFNASGTVIADRFSFDLPDEDLFFPGDVIHYYIYAEDNVGGDVTSSTLPGDLSGFGVFEDGESGTAYTMFDWPTAYTVHGLPTMFSAVQGDQPEILFYNDFGNRGAENEWMGALANLGYYEGIDYDVFYTNAPSSGVSNGLGAKATINQIDGYTTMLYSLGNLGSMGIQPYNQANDKSDDITLLNAWLSNGKNFLATGDGIVSDLVNAAGAPGGSFVSNWFSVSYIQNDVNGLIGGQRAPRVSATGNTIGGATVFDNDFIAFGACPGLNQFDAVSVAGAAVQIADWTDASGNPISGLAAGVANETSGSKIVYFPIDLAYWYTPSDHVSDLGRGPVAARVDVLADIMLYFGFLPQGIGTGVEQAPAVFSASNYPNPFNPSTEIKWSIPRAGDLSIKIFNVRGELVKTLVDSKVTTTSGTEIWNGTNDRDAQVASGVYFYEVRSGSNVVVNKMALVK